jgi:hypothetical protein
MDRRDAIPIAESYLVERAGSARSRPLSYAIAMEQWLPPNQSFEVEVFSSARQNLTKPWITIWRGS